MSRERFQAREKKVQKMGRDGLVEHNRAIGEEKRVSQRTADAAFDRARPTEREDIRRPAVRGADTGKKRKQPRPAPETRAEQTEPLLTPEYLADATAEPPPDAPATMRGAVDMPLLDAPAAEEPTPAPVRKRPQKRGKTSKKKQSTKFAEHAARPDSEEKTAMRGVEGAPAPKRRTSEGGSRLQFDKEEPADPATDRTAIKKRQVSKLTEHAAKPDSRETSAMRGADRTAIKKRQAAKLADHAAKPEDKQKSEDRLKSDGNPKAGGTRLKFEDTPKDSETAGDAAHDAPTRQQKKYNKAVRRTERADCRVEQAQMKLPAKRRLHMERQPDEASGKMKRRLRFEEEVLPEYRRPSLLSRGAGAVKMAAVIKLHSKIREYERDNVALESAHKSELVAEQGVGRVLRWERNRRRAKPYRTLHKAQQKAARAHTDLAWQTALRDNPELQRKNALAKWVQKQKIKRKYAQAAHEAKQSAKFTQNVLTATGKIARAIAQYAAAHKAVFLAVAMLALVAMFFATGLTSCTAMLSGFQSSYISASYMADEGEICQSDLYYTEKETDLQIDIDNTEENYPGYDEYRYNIGEISHNPYELLGYLSTAFNAFTFAGVQSEIDRIFSEQYTLTREVIVETRYDDDGDPYDWYVLQTTLTVRPLSAVAQSHLSPGEQTDRYGVYMQTYGNRQAFGNPFDFSWLGYVSSGYGWRVHPISGEKSLHRGIDLAVAQGTPILAVQDGRVVSAGDAGSYGLCVVIEDDKGYQSRYAHCSSLNVSAGQEVKRGDVIAAVGSTGNSTGPHLHLEVMLNGEYLNPYFFVDNGDDGTGAIPGTPGGPAIPDYSGEPMGDGSFEAMLHEAEKFLGWPYVWGGSSPSTSFDCSGYVSWVINQSGVGSVGRQTAQGLYNLCTPVSSANAQPGDLIFFTGTYSSPGPVSHVGIYVGGGRFIHCGDPISYANTGSPYWSAHLYGYGRLP
ncbi:CD1108 family mobile element protein [Enterococcus faecalis]|uniref:CD1108 family mobile element protein n=1 Tax=Enterococcus faecalis TaxID=1351 RepID=UPI00032E521D|nr:peptidoglycan DD-metalloendopeptidase family protein [Enterococcus faecalis]EOK37562.1 M24/M37 family peptidase [Enterococcus faecalis EnGen0335]EOL91805.1 M24/M37 family peptidase [Enterococcus faecalis EnGen0341]